MGRIKFLLALAPALFLNGCDSTRSSSLSPAKSELSAIVSGSKRSIVDFEIMVPGQSPIRGSTPEGTPFRVSVREGESVGFIPAILDNGIVSVKLSHFSNGKSLLTSQSFDLSEEAVASTAEGWNFKAKASASVPRQPEQSIVSPTTTGESYVLELTLPTGQKTTARVLDGNSIKVTIDGQVFRVSPIPEPSGITSVKIASENRDGAVKIIGTVKLMKGSAVRAGAWSVQLIDRQPGAVTM